MEKACESGEWLTSTQRGLHTLTALSRGQQTSFCSSFSGAPKALWVLVLWEVLLDMGTWDIPAQGYGGGGAASLRLSSQPPRGQQWGVAAVNCPMRCSDLRLDSQKQRHPSGGVSVSSEMVFQLEGVELGADGKVGAGTMLSGGIGLMHVFWESRLKDVFN